MKKKKGMECEMEDDSMEHEGREKKKAAMGSLLSALKASKSVKRVKSPKMTKSK